VIAFCLLREGFGLTGSFDSIDDINKSCLEQFRVHWQCLDNNNHQLWQCRPAEWKLNRCVFENLVGWP
jgi:NADH dehydrogenase (ubiquinone) 1 alpha subcomplex subunit 8